MTMQAADLSRALQDMDAKLLSAVESGCIRILSLHWLLHVRPIHFSIVRLPRRQDLEGLEPSPFLAPKNAAAALRKGERKVLSLSYGWGSPNNPDPTGEVFANVIRFVEWLVKELRLSPEDLKSYGLFWDYSCLYQKPRTTKEDSEFKKALGVMAWLYASAFGTSVLVHRKMPTCPMDLEGVVMVFDLAGSVTEEELQLLLRGAGSTAIVEPGVLDGDWTLTFASHEEAVRQLDTLRGWVASRGRGYCTLGYNSTPYEQRGWCTVESALSKEVVGRSRQRGFEEVAQIVDSLAIAKVYEISGAAPRPLAPDQPQDPTEIQAAVEAAVFTSGSDRQLVMELYQGFRRTIFRTMDVEGQYWLYDDNTVTNITDERARLGGGGGGTDWHGTIIEIDAKEAAEQQERAAKMGGFLAAMLHTLPIGLVQFSDYASDLLVLWQLRLAGDVESFTIGAWCVGVSIGAVWLIFVFVGINLLLSASKISQLGAADEEDEALESDNNEAPEQRISDREQMLALVTAENATGDELYQASEELQADKEVVLAAVKNRPRVVQLMNVAFREDRDIMLAAVEKWPDAIGYTDSTDDALKDALQAELGKVVRAKALVEVTRDAWALEDQSDFARGDKEVVLAAVTNDGLALQFAWGDVLSDKQVVLAAVKQDGVAIQFAYLQDAEIEAAAAAQDLMEMQRGSPLPPTDRIVDFSQTEAVKLKHATPEQKADKELVLSLVRRSGFALKYAAPELRADKEVAAAAVETHHVALRYISAALQADRDFIEAPVRRNGLALQYVSHAMRADRELVLLAVAPTQAWITTTKEEVVSSELNEVKDDMLCDLIESGKTHSGKKHIPCRLLGRSVGCAQDNDYIKAGSRFFKREPNADTCADGLALQFASAELRADRDVVLSAVSQDGMALQFASAKLVADPALVLAAIEQNPLALQFAAPKLREDRDIVLAAVTWTCHWEKWLSTPTYVADPFALESVEPELNGKHTRKLIEAIENGRRSFPKKEMDDTEGFPSDVQKGGQYIKIDDNTYYEATFTGNGLALEHANPGFYSDREVVMSALRSCAVGESGKVLKLASNPLKADLDILLAAVEFDHTAFEHAADKLKEDKEAVQKALDKNSNVIDCVSESITCDRSIMMKLVEMNALYLANCSDTLKDDFEFMTAALEFSVSVCDYASERLQADKTFMLKALKDYGQGLYQASEELKADRDVVIAAVSNHGQAIDAASRTVMADREVALAACEQDGSALQLLRSAVDDDEGLPWNPCADKGVVLAAVKNNGQMLDCASEALKADREVIEVAVADDEDALKFAAKEIRSDADLAMRVSLRVMRKNGALKVVLDHGLPTCLLAPLNLHVLYLGVQHASLRSEHAEVIDRYQRVEKQASFERDVLERAIHRKYLKKRGGRRGRQPTKEEREEEEAEVDKLDEQYKEFLDKYLEDTGLSSTSIQTVIQEVETLFRIFVVMKMIETAFESIGLSVLTSAALFSPTNEASLDESGLWLLYASLALSVASMAYGFFVSGMQGDALWAKNMLMWDFSLDDSYSRVPMLRGKEASFFLAVFVHTAWVFVAIGSCWGAASLDNVWRYSLPGSLVLLQYAAWVGVVVSEIVYGIMDENAGDRTHFIVFLFLGVPMSLLGLAVDVTVLQVGFARMLLAFGDPQLQSYVLLLNYVLPLCRRVSLVAMITASLYADYSDEKLAFLGAFGVADLFASFYIFETLKVVQLPRWLREPATCLEMCRAPEASKSKYERLREGSSEYVREASKAYVKDDDAEDDESDDDEIGELKGPSATATAMVSAPSAQAHMRVAERKAAAEKGFLRLIDMIDGVLSSSAQAQQPQDAHFVTRSELLRACETIRAGLSALSSTQHVAVSKALTAYLPSSDAHAEADLLQKLKPMLPTASGVEAAGLEVAMLEPVGVPPPPRALAMSGVASGSESRLRVEMAHGDGSETAPEEAAAKDAHPMRGVLLMHVLQSEIWSTKRTFAGRTKRRSNYELSMPVERVGYFVSHAWPDDAARKLAMLREFLCLQDLIGRLFVSLPVLSIFLLPLGLGFNSVVPWLPWWALSGFPIAIVVVVTLWVILSCFDLVPLGRTPWAFSSTLVWLDTCCLDQSTPQTISEGVAGLPRFLQHSERMVAFVSEEYFQRLWTVYELATFCRQHVGKLEGRLLLLSLEWPSTINPFKQKSLDGNEISWLKSFSCLDARCYKPSDRAMLLGFIEKEWESTEKFDAFVRTKLRQILEQSKLSYQGQLGRVAQESFQLVFSD